MIAKKQSPTAKSAGDYSTTYTKIAVGGLTYTIAVVGVCAEGPLRVALPTTAAMGKGYKPVTWLLPALLISRMIALNGRQF